LKRRLHHHFVSRAAITHDEDEAEPHKKPVLDARAQLLSTAQADTRQPIAPEVDDVAPAPAPTPAPVLAAAEAAAKLVAAAPVAAQPIIDQNQYASDRAAPRTNAEMLLAALNEATDSSVAPLAATAAAIPDEDHQESARSRMGMVLIAMGLAFLIGSPFARRLFDSRAAQLR
jgi:uncharacterized membrane protein